MATTKNAAQRPSGGLLGMVRALTLNQISEIETATGVPFNRWTADAPKAELYPLVLSALTGDPADRFARMTMGELLDTITDLEARETIAGPSVPSEP